MTPEIENKIIGMLIQEGRLNEVEICRRVFIRPEAPETSIEYKQYAANWGGQTFEAISEKAEPIYIKPNVEVPYLAQISRACMSLQKKGKVSIDTHAPIWVIYLVEDYGKEKISTNGNLG